MKINSRPGGEYQVPNWLRISIWLLIIVCVGVGWKAVWLSQDVFPFNADEAITGLMARHILQGARPVFFYGQSYMGSLDAFLVAGAFRFFGESVLSIRIIQVILYTCTIITTAWLGKSITNSWRTGLIAGLFMAVPAVNVTLYSTVSLGGYGEALIISNIAFLCAVSLNNRSTPEKSLTKLDWILVCLLGFITGLGFWVFGLTLVATIPAVILAAFAVYEKRNFRKTLLLITLLAGFFILGSLPWWVASLRNGIIPLISELSGSAVSVEGENWFYRTTTHLFYFVFFGLPAVFGFRPPWEVRWLGLPFIPVVLIGWGTAFWFFRRQIKTTTIFARKNWWMVIGSIGLLTAGYLFTPFGLDPSGRYFLPLAVPLSLLLAWVLDSYIKKQWILTSLVLFLLTYHAIGTWQSAGKNPPGITTQFDAISWIDHRYDTELMKFLRDNGESRGYSNYWVSYPLAFLSKEEIIFSPGLPYHADLRYTNRDDRYPDYTRAVQDSKKTAYITTLNPKLDEKIRQEFTRLDITWKEKMIGNYQIFYQLSRPVHPQEIGIGTSNPENNP
jgi:4-amino-4-deoxy-L-arabinose transferase-like glycosyltransferase